MPDECKTMWGKGELDDESLQPAADTVQSSVITKLSPRAAAVERTNRINYSVLCFLVVIDGLDIQLLPASMRALEAELGLSLTQLSMLAVCQGITMAFGGPIWANLADGGVKRGRLLAFGAGLWGSCTLCMAGCSSFYALVFLRLLNGVALGMMNPVAQSIIAEAAPRADRGYYFGFLGFVDKLFGEAASIIFVAAISNQVIYGLPGWRVAYILVGVLSLGIAVAICKFLNEAARPWRPELLGLSAELRKFIKYWQLGTFRVIAFQGMFSATARAATLIFAPLYFQYVGLSDLATGGICACLLLGNGMGILAGGLIGDRLALWSPSHGRCYTAQTSLFLGALTTVTLFVLMPRDPSMAGPMAGICFLLGSVSCWSGAGCNRPILVDIVAHEDRSSILAWDLCLEKGVGTFLGPLGVGYLSQHFFGYRTSQVQVEDMSDVDRMRNMDALRDSIIWCSLVPMFIAIVIYSFLPSTLSADVRKAAEQSENEPISDANGGSETSAEGNSTGTQYGSTG